MRENNRIYGGFSGIKTSRLERNYTKNPTYLSCKLNPNNYCNEILIAADNCIVDGFIFIDAQRSSGVTRRRLKNSVSDSVEEILSSRSVQHGGGIYSNSTNITVVNSIFYMLYSAGKGGGIYCIGQQGLDENNVKSPTLINEFCAEVQSQLTLNVILNVIIVNLIVILQVEKVEQFI